jgi:copper chaperone CopZ
MKTLYLAATFLAVLALHAVAQQPASPPEAVKATFLISGLHCPPCTSTVESSLKRVKGVQTAKVDWRSKNARVTFDESQISSQEVAMAIANTPHMMGGSLKYSGALALKVAGLNDDAANATAKKALTEIPGVANVWIYAQQGAVAVDFDHTGKVTSKHLIDALEKAGFTASEF